jgi:hypothetical protein
MDTVKIVLDPDPCIMNTVPRPRFLARKRTGTIN